jgi:hypothetical protein
VRIAGRLSPGFFYALDQQSPISRVHTHAFIAEGIALRSPIYAAASLMHLPMKNLSPGRGKGSLLCRLGFAGSDQDIGKFLPQFASISLNS